MINRIRTWINSTLTTLAMRVLAHQLQHDESYAWSWQSNLAMAISDAYVPEGADAHERANRGAALFLKRAFDVDVKALSSWHILKTRWWLARRDRAAEQS